VTLERINFELNAPQKLQILRQELQDLEAELVEIESRIRDALETQARRSYLQSLAPYYQQLPASDDKGDDPAILEQNRQVTADAIDTMQSLIPALENAPGASAAPAPMPASTKSPAPKKRLQSFDDFLASGGKS